MAPAARRLEALGFDAAYSGEAGRDPFLELTLAAEHTTRLELGSGVAIVLPRNPMQVAQTAHDLQAYSRGRFILGLGTQVRPHIERRFGVEWSRPVERMREFVLALRAIWRAWNERAPLDFVGEYHRHTLMTPLFDPGPNPFGAPRVFLAAVGPRMATVAGEVADGLLVHSFVTDRYVREVLVPAIDVGLKSAGRDRSSFELVCVALTLDDDDDGGAGVRAMRDHLAFYGSTSAYRGVLDIHGWGDLQPELNALLRSGRREGMRALITDDVLAAFVSRGAPSEIPHRIADRFGGVAGRIILNGPYAEHHAGWIDALHHLTP